MPPALLPVERQWLPEMIPPTGASPPKAPASMQNLAASPTRMVLLTLLIQIA